jgi:hypothetical protein
MAKSPQDAAAQAQAQQAQAQQAQAQQQAQQAQQAQAGQQGQQQQDPQALALAVQVGQEAQRAGVDPGLAFRILGAFARLLPTILQELQGVQQGGGAGGSTTPAAAPGNPQAAGS